MMDELMNHLSAFSNETMDMLFTLNYKKMKNKNCTTNKNKEKIQISQNQITQTTLHGTRRNKYMIRRKKKHFTASKLKLEMKLEFKLKEEKKGKIILKLIKRVLTPKQTYTKTS